MIVGLPLILVIALDIFPRILSAKRKADLVHFGKTGSLKQRGHFHLAPFRYNRGDRARFHRADREHDKVVFWISNGKSRVNFLSGRSGTGKSSLLQAHVLPKLTETPHFWKVVSLHAGADALQDMCDALLKPGTLWQDPPTEISDPMLLLIRACEEAGRFPLLFVWDQFEEFLLQNSSQPQRLEQFEAFINQMEEHGPDNLRLLFVFRTDYLHSVLEMELPSLKAEDNWMEISPFLVEHARDFLMGSELGIPPQLMDHILHESFQIEETKGLVRPITLNMIGKVLEHSAKGSWARLAYDKGMLALQNEYLNNCLNRPGIRNYVAHILRPMLTEEGTKRPRSLAELVEESGSGEEIVRGCLLSLGNEGLVRQVDDGLWSISHDYVAKQLDLILRRWRQNLFRRLRTKLVYGSILVWALSLFVLFPMVRATVQSRCLQSLIALGGTVSDYEDGLAVRLARNPRLERAAMYLARLHNLKKVDLSQTNVIDLRPLSELPHLRALSLDGAANVDLSTLGLVQQLTELSLGNLPFKDIELLTGLKYLTSVDLEGTRVENLVALNQLTRLKRLSLKGTSVRSMRVEAVEVDFTELSLEALMSLQVTPSNVAFLTELASLKLEWLNLADTHVDRLEPLTALNRLTGLDLSGSEVKDAAPLAKLPLLEFLDLSRTGLMELGFLKSLDQLKNLSLAENKVKQLDHLSDLNQLTQLDLARTDVADLSPLNVPLLRELDLSYTYVGDLTPIATLQHLTKLKLAGSALDHLEPWPMLQQLEELDLSETEVVELSALAQATRLVRLDLSRTDVTDLKPLHGLTSLRILVLQDSQIPDNEVAALRAALPSLGVNVDLNRSMTTGTVD